VSRPASIGWALLLPALPPQRITPAGPARPALGRLEAHVVYDSLEASRRFREALASRSYTVTYMEVPGVNHAPQWWRLRLAYGIAALSAGWQGGP